MKLPSSIDRSYWTIYIFLMIYAVLAIFSATSLQVYNSTSMLLPVGKQMIFLIVGAALAYFVQYVPTIYIRLSGYIILAVAILFLILVSIPGSPFAVVVNGAARWMRLGPITFQPSDLAKMGLVIVDADLLSRIETEEDKKKYFFWTLGITGFVALLIMTQNLSTAVLIAGVLVIMWFLAHIPWKYILSTIGIAVLALLLGYIFVDFAFVKQDKMMSGPFKRATVWVKRIDNKILEMKQPDTAEFKLTDDNYQSSIAKVAIARGGKSPIGVLPGNSKERDFLPLAFMDYIFAIIVEESGILGAIFLCFLYLMVLYRACYTSHKFQDQAATLLAMAAALMTTCQALFSMMVAVGIFPVTGQPLPLISMGGTGVVVTSLYFGIMMAVSREQTAMKQQQQITQDAANDDTPIITLDQ